MGIYIGEKMNKDVLEKGIKIKIIGDSIAAGAGSSKGYKTEELIFEDNEKKFFRRVAPNSWWGLLEQYLRDNYITCTVENKGCGGAFSYQINKYLDTLISIFLILNISCPPLDQHNHLKHQLLSI